MLYKVEGILKGIQIVLGGHDVPGAVVGANNITKK